jgi:hypothetical protein
MTTTTRTTTDAPDALTVEALEAYGYKAAAVRKWTPEKALVALDARRKEEAIARRRALRRAGEEEEAIAPRGQPIPVMRLQAAVELEREQGVDELVQGLAYTVHQLTDDEVRRLAGWLVKLFRGQK